MTLFYSPSARGFFDDTIHKTCPDDVVEIDKSVHEQLMTAQEAGKQIVPGPDGRPIAIDPAAPSHEQLMDRLRVKRDRLLAASDFSQLPDVTLDESARTDWRAYRQALRDLPEIWADNPGGIVWPEIPQTEPEKNQGAL